MPLWRGHHFALARLADGFAHAEYSAEQCPPEQDVDPRVKDGVDRSDPDGSQICSEVVDLCKLVGKDTHLETT